MSVLIIQLLFFSTAQLNFDSLFLHLVHLILQIKKGIDQGRLKLKHLFVMHLALLICRFILSDRIVSGLNLMDLTLHTLQCLIA